jgi:hypothetical protein
MLLGHTIQKSIQGEAKKQIAWCLQKVFFFTLRKQNRQKRLSRNTNKMQLVIEFIIPKFTEGSTRFERHTAHHQELYTVYAASGLYTHVLTGRCPG